MQKSYECELATHIGPESCGAARKGSVEALTGERAGRVFSRVRNFLRDADAVRRSGRPHLERRYREALQSPARSETPCTYADTSLGNREIRLTGKPIQSSPPDLTVAIRHLAIDRAGQAQAARSVAH